MAEDTSSAGRAHDRVATDLRTFLIADVRGYTRYTREYGDDAASTLTAWFAGMVRATVPEFGGELLELRGDEALCVFGSARQALRAAVELQRRLRTSLEGEEVFPLGVGMGVDAGEAVPTEGGYRGGALNVASRLCAATGPGQVLATESVAHLAQKVDGLRYQPPRSLRLKGIEVPIRAVEVRPTNPLPPLPPTPPTPRARYRRWAAVGLVVTALVILVGVAVWDSSARPASPSVPVRIDSVAVVDPATGRVARDISVGTSPWAIAVGSGAVWVANTGDGTVSRIGTRSMRETTIGLGGTPEAIAAGLGYVWAFDTDSGQIFQIDPKHLTVFYPPYRLKVCRVVPGQLVPTTCRHGGIAAGYGQVWVTDGLSSVYALTPSSGDFRRVPGNLPAQTITTGNGAVYTSNGDNLATIQPSPMLQLGQSVTSALGIVATTQAIWGVSPAGGFLTKVSPDPSDPVQLGQKRLQIGLNGVTTGDGSVWVTNEAGGSLLQIDPGNLNVLNTIRLGHAPTAIAYAAGRIWVTIQDPRTASNQH